MALKPLYGHDKLTERLAVVMTAGRFPQSTLLVGPSGVGKQRLGLWIAQGLLCEAGPGRPCEECRSCRQVKGLVHPDLHWFVPIPRPKASEPDKQVEEVEQLLGEALEERRSGFWGRPDGMVSHPLASVRLLQRRAARAPFTGRVQVILLGDAEWLVVQEASQEAANALLKVLEEPSEHTVVLVTAADPTQLLPTVRSRLIPLRVSRVPDKAVESFLKTEVSPPPAAADLDRLVAMAEGCIGRAITAEATSGEGERLLGAVRQGPHAWLRLVLAQPPWAARGDYSQALASLSALLRRDLAAKAAGADPRLGSYVRALQAVERARAEARDNLNPQLALAALGGILEECA